MSRSFMFVFLVLGGRVGYSIIPDLLGQGDGVGRAVTKKLRCKSVDDNWDGLSVYGVVQVESGSASGMIPMTRRHSDWISGS
jgi:hypothetical protein